MEDCTRPSPTRLPTAIIVLACTASLVAFLTSHGGVTASFSAGKPGNVQADVVRLQLARVVVN